MNQISLKIGTVHGGRVESERLRVYPCLIRPARYGGLYSGAQWHAWPVEDTEIVPSLAYGSDVPCRQFWSTQEKSGVPMVGKGASPDKAHEDLVDKLQEAGRALEAGAEKAEVEDVPGLDFYTDS